VVTDTAVEQKDTDMRYQLLIHTDESQETALSPGETTTMNAAYTAFVEEANAAGVLRGGERLQPTSTATTVRVRDGETLTTDGPYAETKEQFAGFFIVDCPDLDAAIGWASRVPGALHGAIEVRPIWEMA
jgi:hypothetical protein